MTASAHGLTPCPACLQDGALARCEPYKAGSIHFVICEHCGAHTPPFADAGIAARCWANGVFIMRRAGAAYVALADIEPVGTA